MRPAVVKVCNQLNLTRVWVTPFFRVTEHVPKLRELTTFMKSFEPDSHRVILQIMGTDAERLAETALRAMEASPAERALIKLSPLEDAEQVFPFSALSVANTVMNSQIFSITRESTTRLFSRMNQLRLQLL